jgi:hypothetical protein
MKLPFASWLLVSVLIFSGCKKEQKIYDLIVQRPDFSRYIAVGNSITAGFSNGGLYVEGQQFAYPNIIAQQFKKVGGGDFYTPFFPAEQSNGSGYLRLAGFNPDGSPVITQVTDKLAIRGQVAVPGFGNVTLYTKYAGPINNYGVPGMKVQQITYAPLGNLNGYYERLLPAQAGENTTTYLDFVTSKPFTFFSCWLGSNDALGYARAGGEGDSLTDKATFAGLYNLAVNNLTKTGARGVLVTVPDVSSLAFLSTITIPALLEGVKKVNPSINAIYIRALNPATGAVITRAATNYDLVSIEFKTSELGTTVNGLPGYGLSPVNPLSGKVILDSAEVARVRDYTASYNATIKSIASMKALALFDSYDLLNRVKNGINLDGVYVNSTYITGGVFSLDGVHLTQRGNAITANEIIRAINKKYYTHIPVVDASKYRDLP